LDIAFKVENHLNTRTGSSHERTVTQVPNLILSVFPAMAAKTIFGAEMVKSSLWCAPRLIKFMPVCSAVIVHCTASRKTMFHRFDFAVISKGHIATGIKSKFCAILVWAPVLLGDQTLQSGTSKVLWMGLMRVLHGGCKGKASFAPCLQELFGMADLVINQHRLILTDNQIKRPWTMCYAGSLRIGGPARHMLFGAYRQNRILAA
jgi:hypothetical protein